MNNLELCCFECKHFVPNKDERSNAEGYCSAQNNIEMEADAWDTGCTLAEPKIRKEEEGNDRDFI